MASGLNVRKIWRSIADARIFDRINPRLTKYPRGGGLYDIIHAKDLHATRALAKEFGFPQPDKAFSAQPNLIRTSGGTHAIQAALLAHVLEIGPTELIHSNPTFFTVPGWAREKEQRKRKMEAIPVHVKPDLSIDVDGIIGKLHERHEEGRKKGRLKYSSAAVYVAIPENPTGKVLADSEWQQIIDALGKRNTGIFDCVGFNPLEKTLLDLPRRIIDYARKKGKRVMVVGSISKLGGTLSDVRAGYLAATGVDLTPIGNIHLPTRGSMWLEELFQQQPKLVREMKRFYRTLGSLKKLGYGLSSEGSNFTCVIIPPHIPFNRIEEELAAAKIDVTLHKKGEPAAARIGVGTHKMYKDYTGVPFVRIAAVRPDVAKRIADAFKRAAQPARR